MFQRLTCLHIRLFSSSSTVPAVVKPKTETLKSMLKKFYFKVHPDRFMKVPEIAQANAESFRDLQSSIDEMLASSEKKKHPLGKAQKLIFYTWTTRQREEVLQKLSVTLRTSGGNCKHVVKEALTDLFSQAKIAGKWNWDEKFWIQPLMSIEELNKDMEKEAAEGEHAADMERASETMSAEEFEQYSRNKKERNNA